MYYVTLRRPWSSEDLPVPKKPSKLPVILSAEEVMAFLDSIPNLKHRTLRTTVYAAGLRISEATRLTREGANALLQVRCVVLNGQDIRNVKRWYPPDRRIVGAPTAIAAS